ncbi:hypothetical protein CHS0354_016415, partial [Potamilus streckersoni]
TKASCYLSCPENPSDTDEQCIPVYKATLFVRNISHKEETDYSIRKFELCRKSDDGK